MTLKCYKNNFEQYLSQAKLRDVSQFIAQIKRRLSHFKYFMDFLRCLSRLGIDLKKPPQGRSLICWPDPELCPFTVLLGLILEIAFYQSKDREIIT